MGRFQPVVEGRNRPQADIRKVCKTGMIYFFYNESSAHREYQNSDVSVWPDRHMSSTSAVAALFEAAVVSF